MFVLKSIVVVLVIVQVAQSKKLTDEQKQKMLQYHNECVKESGVDELLVLQAVQGKFSEDPKFKEQSFCFLKKIGFLDEAGNIQNDKLREKMGMLIEDDGAIDQMIKNCGKQMGNPQDTALGMMKCLHDEKVKLNIE